MRRLICLALLALCTACKTTLPLTSTTTYQLYSWGQRIGTEVATQRGDGSTGVIVHYDYRGSVTDLHATVTERGEIDYSGRVTPSVGAATVDVASEPGTPFPLTVLESVATRWLHTNRPAILHTPAGDLELKSHGVFSVKSGGQNRRLACVSIAGMGWGRAWLWLDEQWHLAAAVLPNARTSVPIHAVRRDYEDALSEVIATTARVGSEYYRASAKELASDAFALTHARIIDGNGGRPIDDGAIVIERGRVSAVGRDVAVPLGTRTIDVRGKTVVPGLWDMHAHLTQVEWGPVYLAAGVTTVRDLGNTFEFVRALRDTYATGLLPRIIPAGFIDAPDPTSPTGYQASSPQEGRRLVDMYAEAGFEAVKVWNNVPPDVLRSVAERAHQRGMRVIGHVPKNLTAQQAIEAGQDEINHIDYILHSLPSFDPTDPATSAALDDLARRGIVVEPTLPADEMFTRSLQGAINAFEPGIAFAPRSVVATLERFGVPAENAAGAATYFDGALKVVGALHARNVPIVAGTDMIVPGHSLHRALELLVRAGFTPLEAISSATSIAARVAGRQATSGTIEPGKVADLVVLDADPSIDIRNIRSVRFVVRGGVMFDSSQLWELGGFLPPDFGAPKSPAPPQPR
jgi:imidazolonepropionase-like amidohydrolase